MKPNIEFQEIDKNKQIKQIIAREGLVIISILFIGMIWINYIFPNTETTELGWSWGIIFTMLAYPLYLLVRFILWAIKTLRRA